MRNSLLRCRDEPLRPTTAPADDGTTEVSNGTARHCSRLRGAPTDPAAGLVPGARPPGHPVGRATGAPRPGAGRTSSPEPPLACRCRRRIPVADDPCGPAATALEATARGRTGPAWPPDTTRPRRPVS